MRLKPLFVGGVLGLCASLLTSASFGQSYPCSQSMITGNWVFVMAFPVQVACPISIASNGVVSDSGSCISQIPVVTLPTGNLQIDINCKVTGVVSLTYGSSNINKNTGSLTLWRSLDGSRLSGISLETITYSGGSSSSASPIEIIFVPQPP
jgi:hypothetical protein